MPREARANRSGPHFRRGRPRARTLGYPIHEMPDLGAEMPAARTDQVKVLPRAAPVREHDTKALRFPGNLISATAKVRSRCTHSGIELNPSSLDARGYYSWFLPSLGRGQEAIDQARQMLRVDPLSTGANGILGSVPVFTHRSDEAIASCAARSTSIPAIGSTTTISVARARKKPAGAKRSRRTATDSRWRAKPNCGLAWATSTPCREIAPKRKTCSINCRRWRSSITSLRTTWPSSTPDSATTTQPSPCSTAPSRSAPTCSPST